ncbi:MAG: epoxyqueuosine reductase [Lawsonibacter sp.]|nr:epoxyqueuosine reductase [Lawsonibacter sp.]
MTNRELMDKIIKFTADSPENYIPAEDAIRPDLAGMKLYEAPLVGFARADDALFTAEFKKPGIIHPEYQTPQEWLPGARTVVSFFLPFTGKIKESNRSLTDTPYEPGTPQRCSAEWLHGRIEGQIFVNRLTDYIQSLLENEGFESVCPTTSGLLRMITPYISTWSERHAAYAAGLGTFGLSKGLITEKGMCGRYGSVITSAEFDADARPYSGPFEYCTMCGACMAKCPAGAIDKARGCALGKDQLLCAPYVSGSKLPPQGASRRVRYGCGKCQSGVPCESGIPS